MSDKMDMRISGSSTMPGGEYGKVSISGSGKVQGNLKCESLSCSGAGKVKGDMVAQNVSCSGSVKVEGSMDCREKLSTSGSFQCTGPVEAQELKCSGSFQAMGKVTGGEFRISGAMRAEAGVHCREFRSSGSTRIQGDLEAEHVRLKGITEISGLLNAETIEITPELPRKLETSVAAPSPSARKTLPSAFSASPSAGLPACAPIPLRATGWSWSTPPPWWSGAKR